MGYPKSLKNKTTKKTNEEKKRHKEAKRKFKAKAYMEQMKNLTNKKKGFNKEKTMRRIQEIKNNMETVMDLSIQFGHNKVLRHKYDQLKKALSFHTKKIIKRVEAK